MGCAKKRWLTSLKKLPEELKKTDTSTKPWLSLMPSLKNYQTELELELTPKLELTENSTFKIWDTELSNQSNTLENTLKILTLSETKLSFKSENLQDRLVLTNLIS